MDHEASHAKIAGALKLSVGIKTFKQERGMVPGRSVDERVPLCEIAGGHRTGFSVRTTCVRGWVMGVFWVESNAHPLTQVVLTRISEPSLLVLYIRSDKIFVRLC
jgi:hypothetical protein